jgi:glycosyltransferase involved in cell wall biosynthesis
MTPAETPFFSVVIPAYNASHMITDALDSVFAQALDSFEVIVINDGSPDTEQLEKALVPYLDRIIYIARENGGPAAARNTGIQKAQGEYIAFLDSDDEWLPEHLLMMFDILQKDPSIDLVYGDAVNFGDVWEPERTTMDANPSQGLATFEGLALGRCTVIGSSVVVRRSALNEVGGFDEKFVHGEDFDLWLRVAYNGGRIEYQHSVHARRRLHTGNLTADAISSFKGTANVLRKFINEFELPGALKAQMETEIEKCEAAIALERCKQALVSQRYKQAAIELELANRSYRSRKLKLLLYVLRAVPQLVRRIYVKQRLNEARIDLHTLTVFLGITLLV